MIAELMSIPGSTNWKTIIPIEKGWSGERKFYIETQYGEKLLIRVAGIDQILQKEHEFDMLFNLNQLPMKDCKISVPIDFGICIGDQYVYTIYRWVEGIDAEHVLPTLPEKRQYQLGYRAGQILNQIHKVPIDQPDWLWEMQFGKKIDKKIQKFMDSPIKFDGYEKVLDFIAQNRNLIENRPVTFQHGDYHVGNMVVDPSGHLGIIDFNRHDVGDPWEEFNRIVFSSDISPAFASGQINGYFDGEVPQDFFRLMALYIACNMLSSIPWAIPFSEKDVAFMIEQINRVMTQYAAFDNVIPRWYKKIGGITL